MLNTKRLSAAELNKNLNAPGKAAVMVAETTVTNTGSRAANEVVELYIRLQGTSVAEPVRALEGFQTIAIAPGESKRVKFELKPEAFAIWNDRNQFAAEPSKVTVWISPDSAHGSPVEAEIVP